MQAFLIAFTSDFIQKLVYKYEYGETGKMDDYVMFTLSKSPHKNWIDRGQVILETKSDLMEFDLDEGSCIMYEYKYCLHRF